MNERIKELWDTAAKLESDPSWEGQTKFMEKFAELIVRECMRESMDEIVADEEIAQEKDPLIREYLTGNNQGIVDAVVRFRNHFGVEE
jgi:type IV secretory pathway ATPase VirB11/archaellum biosynthesis ATPase